MNLKEFKETVKVVNNKNTLKRIEEHHKKKTG